MSAAEWVPRVYRLGGCRPQINRATAGAAGGGKQIATIVRGSLAGGDQKVRHRRCIARLRLGGLDHTHQHLRWRRYSGVELTKPSLPLSGRVWRPAEHILVSRSEEGSVRSGAGTNGTPIDLLTLGRSKKIAGY